RQPEVAGQGPESGLDGRRNRSHRPRPWPFSPLYRFNLIAWCLTWGLCDQLRRLVVLVDHATEELSPPGRQVQRRAGLAVLVGRSLLAGLGRAVGVVMAGGLARGWTAGVFVVDQHLSVHSARALRTHLSA